jgi:predicted nucleotidyltransferase
LKPSELLVSTEEWGIIKAILHRNFDEEEVFAFGSRVNGHPKKFSDLDLMIKDRNSFSSEKLAFLAEEFSLSDLPFKVDLVLWSEISEDFKKIIQDQSLLLFPQEQI